MKKIYLSIITIFSLFSIVSANGYYYDGFYYHYDTPNNINYYNGVNYYNNYCSFNGGYIPCSNNKAYYDTSRYCYNSSYGNYTECYYGDYYNNNSGYYYNNSYNNNGYYYNGTYYSGNSYYSPYGNGRSYYDTDYEYEEQRDNYYTESEIEQNLDYAPGIFQFDLETEKLKTYSFKTSKNKTTFQTLVKQDKEARKLIIELADSGELQEYETNGLIRNYKDFIYYTNQYFYFLSLQEGNAKMKDDDEINDAILKSYKSSKDSYQKVKTIILNR